MSELNLTSFLTDFTVLSDPRLARRRQYPLLEILLLCVSASLSGYEEWDEIVDFGVTKLAWLREYLLFAAGIPAHETLNRVMSWLEPRGFEKCLITWVQRGTRLPDGAQICLDGKRLRRSTMGREQQTPHAQGGASAVHLLHAWCDEAGLCLGQYQTPDKANEITALPDLLALLDVNGCLLTMDAIGCQKSVTRAIAGAEDFLVLKGNQPVLHTAVKAAFAATASTEAATTAGEKPAHGRVETRTCRVLFADCLPAALNGPEWVGLRTLVEVVATRTTAATGVTTTEPGITRVAAKRPQRLFKAM